MPFDGFSKIIHSHPTFEDCDIEERLKYFIYFILKKLRQNKFQIFFNMDIFAL